MKRVLLGAGLGGLVFLALGLVIGLPDSRPADATASQSGQEVTLTPPPLPGRATDAATAVPSASAPFAPGSPPATPLVTSPFNFPTPEPSSTPSRDCTTVFPLDSIAAIDFTRITLPQLEAAFGQAISQGGRPTRYRFESEGCTLLVSIMGQEAELPGYGTLDLLLERYGPPAAAGLSEGNLALVMVGYGVLFYPEQGMIALFDAPPDDLTRDTPVYTLFVRPPYEVEAQLRRLNVHPVDWLPPLR